MKLDSGILIVISSIFIIVFLSGGLTYGLNKLMKRLSVLEENLAKGSKKGTDPKFSNIGFYYNYLMDFKTPFSFSANKALLLCLGDETLDEKSKDELILTTICLFENQEFSIISNNELYYGESSKGGSSIYLDDNGFITSLVVNLNGAFIQDYNRIDMRKFNIKVAFRGGR